MKRTTLKRKAAGDRRDIGFLRYSTLHVDVLALNIIRHYLQALDHGYGDVADECFTNMQSLDDWRQEDWDR